MDFGNNFLPETGWTFDSASIDAGVLTLQAGGSASITLTSIESSNLLAEALQLTIVSSAFTPKYTPMAYVTVAIEYTDGNSFIAKNPIIDTGGGQCLSNMFPTISNYDGIAAGSFTSMTITFYSFTYMQLTTWTLTKAIVDDASTAISAYGVSITTEHGLLVDRKEGETVVAQVEMNADELTFRALEGDTLVDKIYFDLTTGEYIFDGTLSATVIQVLESLITPNLYADKANIAELTVDRLETHDKIAKFLASDTTDVYWIRVYDQYVQFVASATVTGNEYVYNRNNEQLYWLDETHTGVTTEPGPVEDPNVPVQQYAYSTERIKLQLAYEEVSGLQQPSVIFGYGDENGYSVGRLFKGQTGFEMTYTKSGTGDIRQLILDDAGVRVNLPSYTGTANLRNIVVTTGTPDVSMGNINDIIFKI